MIWMEDSVTMLEVLNQITDRYLSNVCQPGDRQLVMKPR